MAPQAQQSWTSARPGCTEGLTRLRTALYQLDPCMQQCMQTPAQTPDIPTTSAVPRSSAAQGTGASLHAQHQMPSCCHPATTVCSSRRIAAGGHVVIFLRRRWCCQCGAGCPQTWCLPNVGHGGPLWHNWYRVFPVDSTQTMSCRCNCPIGTAAGWSGKAGGACTRVAPVLPSCSNVYTVCSLRELPF